MPYKSEKIIIEGTKYDRRKRLSEEERAKIRSKTFEGIAEAMAYQWG